MGGAVHPPPSVSSPTEVAQTLPNSVCVFAANGAHDAFSLCRFANLHFGCDELQPARRGAQSDSLGFPVDFADPRPEIQIFLRYYLLALRLRGEILCVHEVLCV